MSTDPQGIKVTKPRYQVIARTLIFLYHNDKVLLLKGAPHKRLWANRYNGIGGHVEQGESITECAVREIREETGIDIAINLRLRGTITIDTNANPGIVIFVFTALTDEVSVQGSREGTPEWVNWRTLALESMVEDLPTLLGRLGAMQPSDPPFSAHYSYDESGTLSIRFEG